jgi:hypothetical protein
MNKNGCKKLIKLYNFRMQLGGAVLLSLLRSVEAASLVASTDMKKDTRRLRCTIRLVASQVSGIKTHKLRKLKVSYQMQYI